MSIGIRHFRFSSKCQWVPPLAGRATTRRRTLTEGTEKTQRFERDQAQLKRADPARWRYALTDDANRVLARHEPLAERAPQPLRQLRARPQQAAGAAALRVAAKVAALTPGRGSPCVNSWSESLPWSYMLKRRTTVTKVASRN
jgi:hypothetical protein